MPDRKKVIKALEFCLMPTTEEELMSDVCSHDDCPYYRTYSGGKCISAVCSDAFALLKAQEPIEARLHLCESCTKEYAECEADKTDLVYGSDVGNDNIIGCPWYVNRWKAQEPRDAVVVQNGIDGSGGWWFQCPNCMMEIEPRDRYCKSCGQAVKWDG